MKTRTSLAVFALFVTGLAIGQTDESEMGTWKLNNGKSRFAAGATKFTRVVYSPAANGMVKVVLEGVDGAGKRVRNEWTGKFDGEDYPVTGDPFSDTRSYTPVGERTLDITIKKDGQVVLTGQMTLSANGKSRRTTTKGKDASGQDVSSSAVYDKQ
jgi:hypothetical protein